MAEKRKFEFFLLRYVPHAIRERFVDFGLIVAEKGGAGYAGVRFADSWRDLKNLDPIVDIDFLEALKRDIEGQFQTLRDREILMHWLEDSYSNVVQLTHAKPYVSADSEGEIDMLTSLYLKELPMPRSVQSKETGRQAILREMRSQYEQFGVWGFLIHEVPAAKYTKVGDPLKFDFGYRAKNDVKLYLFHAVSLKANVNAAVNLASRYPMIANAMRNSGERIEPALTAVVDDGLQLAENEIGFALGMMKDNGITVRPVADMPAIALETKGALGL
jgi:hypothetical protein